MMESFFLFVGIGGTILGIWLVYLGESRNLDINKHPTIKKLMAQTQEFEKKISLLEHELKEKKKENLDYQNPLDMSNFLFMPNFLVHKTFFTYRIYFLGEMAWIYVLKTKHSVNFIPTGTTYSIKICTINGVELEIKVSGEEESKEALEELINWAPFAIFGYNDEIKRVWSKDRASFIHEVTVRAKQFFDNPEKFLQETHNPKEKKE